MPYLIPVLPGDVVVHADRRVLITFARVYCTLEYVVVEPAPLGWR